MAFEGDGVGVAGAGVQTEDMAQSMKWDENGKRVRMVINDDSGPVLRTSQLTGLQHVASVLTHRPTNFDP